MADVHFKSLIDNLSLPVSWLGGACMPSVIGGSNKFTLCDRNMAEALPLVRFRKYFWPVKQSVTSCNYILKSLARANLKNIRCGNQKLTEIGLQL